jgi:serine/threonine protein kinase
MDRTRDAMADLHIIRSLGSGSSGHVRQCVHRPTGAVVALKSIPLDVLDKGVRDRVLRELAQLYRYGRWGWQWPGGTVGIGGMRAFEWC